MTTRIARTNGANFRWTQTSRPKAATNAWSRRPHGRPAVVHSSIAQAVTSKANGSGKIKKELESTGGASQATRTTRAADDRVSPEDSSALMVAPAAAATMP